MIDFAPRHVWNKQIEGNTTFSNAAVHKKARTVERPFDAGTTSLKPDDFSHRGMVAPFKR